MCTQPEGGSHLPVLLNLDSCLMRKGTMTNDINMITLLQLIVILQCSSLNPFKSFFHLFPQGITLNDFNKLSFDMILMSPPCQPFTR